MQRATRAPAKVCVIGGGGGIGQPLSLLIKLNPDVTHLAVFDLVGAPGVACDLSHVDTPCKVTGHGMTIAQFTGDKKIPNQDAYQASALAEALKGADIVIIPAGVPRKPGMTRQDLFSVNAGLIKGFADAVAKNCPKAMIAVVTNPVNSTVPIFAEQLKVHGVYDPKRLFGVTSLDLVRARTFISDAVGQSADVSIFDVPVIGGHAGKSILPLLSRTRPEVLSRLPQAKIEALTDRIQNGGTEVVDAKAGAGSATLSMARAGAEFVAALLRALNGEDGVVECAFVDTACDAAAAAALKGATACEFFATPVVIGRTGVVKNLGLGNLSEYEKKKLQEAIAELKPAIKEGIDFVRAGVSKL